MKVLTFSRGGNIEVGVMKNDGSEVVPVNYLGCTATDMNSFLDVMTAEKQAKLDKNKELMRGIPTREVTILSPTLYPKQDVLCLGINYYEHAEEAVRFDKEAFGSERPQPIYFSKRVNRAVGHDEFVDGHWDIVDGLDYEVELAVILGKDAKNVQKEDAMNYVFGYTILNDFSARNLQTAHKQWYFGKSLDDFTAIGPWIVTRDELGDAPELRICCYVNDEIRQESNTSLMVTDIQTAISQLSAGMTLQTGTIIAMGTPAGVGLGFDPPKFLKKSDVVRCEIEGIGTLTNYIK